METLLSRLASDHPKIIFHPSNSFFWSPKKSQVYYDSEASDNPSNNWTLLHEVAHGLLKHTTYHNDFGLLQMEIAAWEKAQRLAKKYDIVIDNNHIEDCLDTYRDWLYQRSTCPRCTTTSLQIEDGQYSCFNCNEKWRVSSSRLCRTYRRKQKRLPEGSLLS